MTELNLNLASSRFAAAQANGSGDLGAKVVELYFGDGLMDDSPEKNDSIRFG